MPEILQDKDGNKIAILVIDDFELELATKFVCDLSEVRHSADIVYVVINSDGGDTRAMYAILDAINAYPDVIAVCGIGTCGSSAAFLLFSAAKQIRYAAPTTDFLLHTCSVTSASGERSNKRKQNSAMVGFGNRRDKRLVKRFKAETDEKIISLVSDASGCDADFIIRKIDEHDGEWTFSAEEALSYGFIDYIGVPFLDET